MATETEDRPEAETDAEGTTAEATAAEANTEQKEKPKLALEVKIASQGSLGVGGAVAMVLGAVMLINTDVPELRVRWSTAIALAK